MIREMLNLICPLGHKHYSPTPEAFVGQGCAKPLGQQLTTSGDILKGAKRCPERLERFHA